MHAIAALKTSLLNYNPAVRLARAFRVSASCIENKPFSIHYLNEKNSYRSV